MKRIPKILSLLFPVIMTFSFVTAASSTFQSSVKAPRPDMPVRNSFYNADYYDEWYRYDYSNLIDKYEDGTITEEEYTAYFANLWFRDTTFWDQAECPEEFLALYEKAFSSGKLDSRASIHSLAVDDYEWNNSTVSLDCTAVFNVKYTWTLGAAGWFLNCNYSNGDRCIGMAAVITNKSDGSIVGYDTVADAAVFTPDIGDYYIGSHGHKDTAPEDFSFTSECSKTVEFSVPWYYDPDVHDLKVFYCTYADGIFLPSYSSPFVIEGYAEPEPVYYPGDANADGKINLTDATVMLQYIAGWDDAGINEKLADIDGNGRVGLMDVQLLLQKIAWE